MSTPQSPTAITALNSKPTSLPATTNTSGYAFHPLTSLPSLRDNLLQAHKNKYAATLRGTILLAGEGVNIRLSGPADVVEDFKAIIESTLSLPPSLVHYKVRASCEKAGMS